MLIFFSSSFSPALASIFTCDSTGNEKTSFYTNETVYIRSITNITNESKRIKFYIATHRSWSLGINLTEASNFSKTITTNSSGHVPITLLWSPSLIVGNYDVIADVNNNATFDPEDLLYNGTGDGFSVIEEPKPKLTISKGEKSPGDHELYENNVSLPNVMLQVKLQAGTYEDVSLESFYISAFGSGDDKNGIKYVVVCVDNDEDGNCEFGENIVGLAQYMRDDGIAKINLKNLIIARNSTLTLVFYYLMRNDTGSYEGKTYSFELFMIEALGLVTHNRAIVEGLPIKSATKTVYFGVAPTTTSTTSTTSTTTTTIPLSLEPKEEESINLFVGVGVAIFTAVAIITIFYFFFLRTPQQVYTYKPTKFKKSKIY